MEEYSLWSIVQTMLCQVFVLVQVLALLPWRKSLRTMGMIAAVVFAGYIPFMVYIYFYSQVSFVLFWSLLVPAFLPIALVFAKYRDMRTIFGIVSALSINLSATIMGIVCASSVTSLFLRMIISTLIHIGYTVGICLFLRKPFAAIMELGGKSWHIGCVVPLLPFLAMFTFVNVRPFLSQTPSRMLTAALLALTVVAYYIMMAQFFSRVQTTHQMHQMYNTMGVQVDYMHKQMQEAFKQEERRRVLWHDLRHFTNLVDVCLQAGLYNDARTALNTLVANVDKQNVQVRYCRNTTINVLMNFFAGRAERQGVQFVTQIVLEDEIQGMDQTELAVLVSNLVENALNACEKEPQGQRCTVKVKMQAAGGQMFITVGNTSTTVVKLDAQTKLPVAMDAKEGHGVGMVSVQAFLQKYNGQFDCEQKDDWFSLRIVV